MIILYYIIIFIIWINVYLGICLFYDRQKCFYGHWILKIPYGNRFLKYFNIGQCCECDVLILLPSMNWMCYECRVERNDRTRRNRIIRKNLTPRAGPVAFAYNNAIPYF